MLVDNALYDDGPMRSNSALAHYLNKTTKMITDYEVPVNTRSQQTSGFGVQFPGRQLTPESIYIQMEGQESVNASNQKSEFTDSFETCSDSQPDNGGYEVKKVNNRCSLVCGCVYLYTCMTLCLYFCMLYMCTYAYIHACMQRSNSKKLETDSVFDIYRSLAPDDDVYWQFMDEVRFVLCNIIQNTLYST